MICDLEPLLVEAGPELKSLGVHLEAGLIQDGRILLLTNHTGFTIKLPAGYEVGAATKATIVSPVTINRVESTTVNNTSERKGKLWTFYRKSLQLPPED